MSLEKSSQKTFFFIKQASILMTLFIGWICVYILIHESE